MLQTQVVTFQRRKDSQWERGVLVMPVPHQWDSYEGGSILDMDAQLVDRVHHLVKLPQEGSFLLQEPAE